MYIKSHKIKGENTVQFIFKSCEEAVFPVFFNDLNVNALAAKAHCTHTHSANRMQG